MHITNSFFDAPWIRNSARVRTFLTAAWLGWQVESNWADPFLFAIYSIARPVASVMILVIMYSVVTGGQTQLPIFAYIYLGNALYIMVAMVITGVSWVLIDDREHYRVAKQLFTAPMDHYYYLMGRGVARLIIGTISVLITVVFGIIVYKLPITFASIDWLLLVVTFPLGILALAAMGLALGALTMQMARHSWQVGDAVAGALYLFSGAIFPLETLPVFIRPLGFVFPVTFWLEAMRRALLGPSHIGFPTLEGIGSWELVGILAGFTVLFLALSGFIYRWSITAAQKKGLLDLESGY
jgi:ABC-2 type transport system permease protein